MSRNQSSRNILIPFDRLVSQRLILPSVELDREMNQIIELAERCFTKDVLPYVVSSFKEHQEAEAKGHADGRFYLKLVRSGQIIGICGLHHLNWHPRDTFTAGWFFADQQNFSAVTPRLMARGMLTLARSLQCRRLIFDTISTSSNTSLADFLTSQGLRVVGTMKGFYGADTDQTTFEYLLPEQ